MTIYFMKRRKKGLRQKMKMGTLTVGSLVRAGLCGEVMFLKEGISHLTGGGHSIQVGDFMLRPEGGNMPGLFKQLEDDQCDWKMRWEQSRSRDVNRAQRMQEL